MKITEIKTLFIDRYLFVQVYTDEGLTGLGESGAWGFLEASAGAVETFKRYLIGQDPLRIEHHWQYLYRWTHFRGAAIMGALSAIDIALWDIAGKYFGVPCYQLEDGFLIIPEAPGLGIELAEDAAERYPFRPLAVETRLHVDGSVVDQ